MHILHIQTIKAVQDFSSNDWRNKFVIEFRGEEGMNECARYHIHWINMGILFPEQLLW